MKFSAKYRRCLAHFLLIFFKYRCSGKTKEYSIWERTFDSRKHFTKSWAVTFINNKNDTLFAYFFNIMSVQTVFIILDIAHFLNRCHYQSINRSWAFQLCDKNIGILSFLYAFAIISKIIVFNIWLISEFYPISKKNYFICILRVCNKLSRLKARHSFSRTCCMPNESTTLIALAPFSFWNLVRDRTCGIVLITSHNFQNTVRIISNGVKTDKLVCHRDRDKIWRNTLPIIYDLIIKVCPMKIIIGIKCVPTAGVGIVQRFIGCHCNKYLNKGKQSWKNALVRILLNLIARLAYRNAAAFKFDMYNRHTIYQKHYISSAVIQYLRGRLKFWLSCYLITALTCGDLLAVVYLKWNFFAKVKFIINIITSDRDSFAIYEFIEHKRSTQSFYLLHYLLHFSACQRTAIETINALIIVKENIYPILYQIFLCWIHNNFRRPALIK